MLRREKQQVEVVPDGRPETRPETLDERRERQARAFERALTTPSTFASRKAQAVEAQGPQLVSMGTCERTHGVDTRGNVGLMTVEPFFEPARPARRWYRAVPHGQLQPMFDETTGSEVATALPSMRTRLEGAFPPSEPDLPHGRSEPIYTERPWSFGPFRTGAARQRGAGNGLAWPNLLRSRSAVELSLHPERRRAREGRPDRDPRTRRAADARAYEVPSYPMTGPAVGRGVAPPIRGGQALRRTDRRSLPRSEPERDDRPTNWPDGAGKRTQPSSPRWPGEPWPTGPLVVRGSDPMLSS